jgi:hypothetical protein
VKRKRMQEGQNKRRRELAKKTKGYQEKYVNK